MASQKTLDKKYSVSGNGVVITETTERSLNREDLIRERIEYMNRQNVMLNQIKEIQKQHDILNDTIASIDEMIKSIDDSQTNA